MKRAAPVPAGATRRARKPATPPPPAYSPTWDREDALRALGYSTIIGVDEAGRGPLAGPVVAGAALLPRDFSSPNFHLLHDSKQLDEAQRAALYDEITAGAAWGVGQCCAGEIDQVNIRQASWLAMQRAADHLLGRLRESRDAPPETPIAAVHAVPDAVPGSVLLEPGSLFVLIDGLPYGPGPWPYEAIVKGDARSVSIAAASIIAKVTRDRMMIRYDSDFPGYGFAGHKGYPTPEHRRALLERGPCVLHRRTFAPVRDVLEKFVSNAVMAGTDFAIRTSTD